MQQQMKEVSFSNELESKATAHTVADWDPADILHDVKCTRRSRSLYCRVLCSLLSCTTPTDFQSLQFSDTDFSVMVCVCVYLDSTPLLSSPIVWQIVLSLLLVSGVIFAFPSASRSILNFF